jgi:hypothetical protein
MGLGELDAKEAAGNAYRRRTAEVLLAGEPHRAVVYEVIRKEPEEVPPRREYIDEMLAGAREYGLPDSWLLRIEQGYYTF